MKYLTGFTLMEAMVVVIVLGVLAAVGLPSYSRTIERSYRQEAQDVLFAIYQGERSYLLANNTYFGPPLTQTSPMADWRKIYMDNPNLGAIPVVFTVSASGLTFSATGTRSGGPCNGQTLTIDQARTVGGTWPASGDC